MNWERVCKGTIGIIGPKRMDYENVVNSLKLSSRTGSDVSKKIKGNQEVNPWKGGKKTKSQKIW